MHAFGVPISFMENCWISFECLRGMLLQTYSRDAPANVDSVLSGHHLSDADPPFFVGGVGKEVSNN